MPDKLRAVEQLAKLCGWNEPEKFEHGASKVEGRFAWIAVPPTVEAYLRTLYLNTPEQALEDITSNEAARC